MKPFSYLATGQKIKHLKNEKSLLDEIKSIFYHFQWISLKQVKPIGWVQDVSSCLERTTF